MSTLPSMKAVFTDELDTTTINTTNIMLFEGTTPITLQVDSDSKSAIFGPAANLKVNTTYTIKLSSNIKNQDGSQTLSSDYQWSFTTFNSNPDSGSVSTIAGNGSSGNSDGTGTSASFSSPQHLVMTPDETALYVTDTGNNKIKMISLPAGIVTTIAGATAGTSGYTAGTGTVARFNSPKGIFVDPISGVSYYFISDSGNNSIRKMTTAFAVTNSFGTNTNTAGFVISTSATAQRYRNPEGFAVDILSGSQYTVDTGNHCIRRSTYLGTGVSNSSPTTSCFAGASPSGGVGTAGFVNGLTTTARFNNPKGIAIDKAGNIFIADSGNHSIRMITTSGVVTTIAGNGTSGYVNGHGTNARFNAPIGIATDGSNILYVTDSGNCAIRKLVLTSDKSSSYVSTYAGPTTDITSGNCSFVNDTRLKSRFNNPKGIWRDSNGYLYITDTGNHTIRKITE